MKVRFNKDLKTAKDEQGNGYKISGLRIFHKPRGGREDTFYPLESSMCQAVIFPSLYSDSVAINSGQIELR